MLPISPERMAQKAIFSCFWNKSQLQLNKVCYKVSLCENFQRRSCNTTIHVSNGALILARTVTLQPKI